MSAANWRAAVHAIRSTSVRYATSLTYGRLVKIAHGEIELAYPKEAGFHRATVGGTARAPIEESLTKFFGQTVRLTLRECSAGETTPRSLAEEEVFQREQRERGIDDKIRGHPAVQAAVKILGGELEAIEILQPEQRADLGDSDITEETP